MLTMKVKCSDALSLWCTNRDDIGRLSRLPLDMHETLRQTKTESNLKPVDVHLGNDGQPWATPFCEAPQAILKMLAVSNFHRRVSLRPPNFRRRGSHFAEQTGSGGGQ